MEYYNPFLNEKSGYPCASPLAGAFNAAAISFFSQPWGHAAPALRADPARAPSASGPDMVHKLEEEEEEEGKGAWGILNSAL